uniref:Kazal-like domain-containing protein n=1 Tax=Serinus canaria TaxID=9135 RepID=A0A8C9UEZ8_SERCA
MLKSCSEALSIVLCCVPWFGPCNDSGGKTSSCPNCAQYGKYMCPRDYHPVCGTDGETYGNECVLCLANREDHTHIEIVRRGHC